MSVLGVSLACGFISAPYFSRAYRALFGRAPRDDRRNFRAGEGRTGWFMPPPQTARSCSRGGGGYASDVEAFAAAAAAFFVGIVEHEAGVKLVLDVVHLRAEQGTSPRSGR